jgi:hypothetical protein
MVSFYRGKRRREKNSLMPCPATFTWENPSSTGG